MTTAKPVTVIFEYNKMVKIKSNNAAVFKKGRQKTDKIRSKQGKGYGGLRYIWNEKVN